MQIPHTTGRPSQLRGYRVTVFCVAGADGPAVGASSDALCHSMAAEATVSAARVACVTLSQHVLSPTSERGCTAQALSIGPTATALPSGACGLRW